MVGPEHLLLIFHTGLTTPHTIPAWQCPLVAQSGHPVSARQCPHLGEADINSRQSDVCF
jgi:hypothetical protein